MELCRDYAFDSSKFPYVIYSASAYNRRNFLSKKGRDVMFTPGPGGELPRIKNHLLTALLTRDYEYLLQHLSRVQLKLGEVVYRADSEIDYVYFPETAVVSLLAYTEEGSTTEVGLIGSEGMVGLDIFLGGSTIHDEAIVQVAGTAGRMKAALLRQELRLGSPLQMLLLRYTRSFLFLVTQSVVCSQNHTIYQRLARWLLRMNDYRDTNQLAFTHELIAGMLGSRRAGISDVLGKLRDAKLIKTQRGVITILNRERLEDVACECYGIVREEFDRLYSSQREARKQAQ
jgi:CRP-like cAMP-binding protein